MWMFYLEHWKSIWHMTQVSVSWKSFYEYTVWSIWWTHKCVCDNACVVIFMRACVSLSFVSFSNRLPSLPDVSFPHRWLLNESLPCILLCTCVTVCVYVSKYVFVCVCGYGCVCVCPCSRSHPSCSVARLIGGILVSLERVSVWLCFCGVESIWFVCMLVFACVCQCVAESQTPTPASPHWKAET